MFKIILVVLLWFGCVRNEPLLPSITSELNKVMFSYPAGVQNERNLFVCPENSACNVIHKRFWLPPLIERLCKCPHRRECNWTWSEIPDDYTMSLDNRSQIKFCQDLSQLPNCTAKKPALLVTTNSSDIGPDTIPSTQSRSSQKLKKHSEPRNVTALCKCQEPHYWKLKMNSTKQDEEAEQVRNTYFCSKLKKCSRLEFCGFVRTDTYSTFYRCSCPKGHLCISRDKTISKVEELLFRGDGYKAFCYPV